MFMEYVYLYDDDDDDDDDDNDDGDGPSDNVYDIVLRWSQNFTLLTTITFIFVLDNDY